LKIPTNEKIRLVIIGVGGAIFGLFPAVLSMIGLFWGKEGAEWSLAFLTFGLLICVVTVLYITRTISNFRQGLPRQDERSVRVIQLAGSRAFFISLYIMMVLLLFGNDFFDSGYFVLFLGIISMFVVYAVCWIWYHFRGET